MKFEFRATACYNADEFEKEYISTLESCDIKCTRIRPKDGDEDGWDDYWVGEFDSLGVLMYLISRVGKVVVSDGTFYYRNPEIDGSIEIYDDWRE